MHSKQVPLIALVVVSALTWALLAGWPHSPASDALYKEVGDSACAANSIEFATARNSRAPGTIEPESRRVSAELTQEPAVVLERVAVPPLPTVTAAVEAPNGEPFDEAWSLTLIDGRGHVEVRPFEARRSTVGFDLLPGRWSLAPRTADFAAEFVTIDVPREAGPPFLLKWKLKASGSLAGRVETHTGAPLEDYFVTLDTVPDGHRFSTSTAANGSFQFDGLLDGSYVLVYGDPASPVTRPRPVEFRGPNRTLDVEVLPPLRSVDVRVVDGEGHVVPGALVTATGNRGGAIRGSTNALGVLHAAGLPEGRYRVVASQLAIGRGVLDVEVNADGAPVIEIAVRR